MLRKRHKNICRRRSVFLNAQFCLAQSWQAGWDSTGSGNLKASLSSARSSHIQSGNGEKSQQRRFTKGERQSQEPVSESPETKQESHKGKLGLCFMELYSSFMLQLNTPCFCAHFGKPASGHWGTNSTHKTSPKASTESNSCPNKAPTWLRQEARRFGNKFKGHSASPASVHIGRKMWKNGSVFEKHAH